MDSPVQTIIDKVKTYTLDSLIRVAIERIKKKELVTQPWTLLAYFEIVYREAENSQIKYRATEIVFNDICQQIFELMNKLAFADFKEHVPNKMFHVLAYQQFPFQNQYIDKDIERQYFIFNAENKNSRLNKMLIGEYKISVKQYLDFWKSISSQNEVDNIKNVAETILKKWTIDHENVNLELQKFSNGVENDFYKTFVPEFFLKYPFILFEQERFCIDSRLFKRTIHEFLFRFLLDSPAIKDTFDRRFQNYIDKTLKEIEITYQTDRELKRKGELECDFCISDFLFAECKAIKLKPLAQVNPNDSILRNNLKDITKAYKQIISTANRYQIKKQEYFGVIITYLPFYFSDGSDLWSILSSDIEKFLSENDFELLINPENLFFVDINSWEQIIAILKRKGNKMLKEIFENAKRKNSIERKFEFSMHLTGYK